MERFLLFFCQFFHKLIFALSFFQIELPFKVINITTSLIFQNQISALTQHFFSSKPLSVGVKISLKFQLLRELGEQRFSGPGFGKKQKYRQF